MSIIADLGYKGKNQLGEFAHDFVRFNDDNLF
jgi:hypothetical protein